MIRTYGLTHISLSVKDLQRSSGFYQKIFGAVEMYGNDSFIQIQTPGSHDIIVLNWKEKLTGKNDGVLHFGFRLIDPANVDDLVKEIEAAGGKIKDRGEFVPGEPYVFFYDPDGYEVEVFYEKLPPSLSAFK